MEKVLLLLIFVTSLMWIICVPNEKQQDMKAPCKEKAVRFLVPVSCACVIICLMVVSSLMVLRYHRKTLIVYNTKAKDMEPNMKKLWTKFGQADELGERSLSDALPFKGSGMNRNNRLSWEGQNDKDQFFEALKKVTLQTLGQTDALIESSLPLKGPWMKQIGEKPEALTGKRWGKPLVPGPSDDLAATMADLLAVRGGQHLGQSVTAMPVLSLASHFASGLYGEGGVAGGQAGGGAPQLYKEGVRLATFRNFPVSVPVSALRLAQSGFYYKGVRDATECFRCGATYCGWRMGEHPAQVHARLSPACPMAQGTDRDNLPLPATISTPPILPMADPDNLSMESGYETSSLGPASSSSRSSSSLGSASSSGPASSSTGPASSGPASTGPASSSSGPASSFGPMSLGPVSFGRASVPDLASDSVPAGDSEMSTRSNPTSAVAAMHSLSINPSQPQVHAQAQPMPSSQNTTPDSTSFTGNSRGAYSGVPVVGSSASLDSAAFRVPTRLLDLDCAVYPLYSQMDARRRSFQSWVQEEGVPAAEELIQLGFFYAGYADCVRCFFCGIGLKAWERGDVPAEVHAKWRPTCAFLRLVKGQQFIERITAAQNVNQPRSIGQDGAGGRPANMPVNNGNNRPDSVATVGGGVALLARGSGGQSAPAPASAPAPVPASASAPAPAPVPAPAPGSTSVPDIPAVRKARGRGYTDQQIAEAFRRLQEMGMEQDIEAMLEDILANLYRDQAAPGGGSESSSVDGSDGGGAGGSGAGASLPVDGVANLQSDLQSDCEDIVDSVAEGGPGEGEDDLRARHLQLQQENEQLRSMRTCQRCKRRPVGIIFLPCGHLVACTVCAPDIRQCPRCNVVIKATANVYFS